MINKRPAVSASWSSARVSIPGSWTINSGWHSASTGISWHCLPQLLLHLETFRFCVTHFNFYWGQWAAKGHCIIKSSSPRHAWWGTETWIHHLSLFTDSGMLCLHNKLPSFQTRSWHITQWWADTNRQVFISLWLLVDQSESSFSLSGVAVNHLFKPLTLIAYWGVWRGI